MHRHDERGCQERAHLLPRVLPHCAQEVPRGRRRAVCPGDVQGKKPFLKIIFFPPNQIIIRCSVAPNPSPSFSVPRNTKSTKSFFPRYSFVNQDRSDQPHHHKLTKLRRTSTSSCTTCLWPWRMRTSLTCSLLPTATAMDASATRSSRR